MIITCKKEIPLRWVAFAIMPWASFTFSGQVMAVAFFFSLKKFVENPAALTFILSLPGFISMILQPVVAFLSDRIWTRFGRRKPFIITSQAGSLACMFLMPLMPNFWTLLAVFMLMGIFSDLNAPMEPFKQEIIPPPERGRATGAMTWCSNLATMTFYFIALGRFDDVRYMGGLTLFGETAIYWSAGLLVSAMLLLITLGIREIDQKSAIRGQRLTFKTFFGGLMDRELWPVYILVVGAACLNFYAGLGPLSNLLYTEQWGYTKQEMGINVAVGGIINLFAIGLLTVFADKLNRMRAYQTLICLSLFGNIAYYCYINFVLPDRRPSLVEIIAFGETLSIIGILTGLVYVPLVYDYIRRNKMGTYHAGASLVNRLTVTITLNGVGLFVWGYAALFQPPAGEMTRVVLRGGDQNRKTDVRNILHASSWTYPQDGAPAAASSVDANAWQATGAVSDKGRCWEIRLRDKDSEKLAGEMESLNKQNSPMLAEEKTLRDDVTIQKLKGNGQTAVQEEEKARVKQISIDKITAQIDGLNAILKTRAETFHAQVVKTLGDRLIAEGDQVLGATARQALILDLVTTRRPDSRHLENMLRDLRREHPGIIDLRPLKRDGDEYGISISAILEPGADEATLAAVLQSSVERAASKYGHDLFTPGAAPLQRVRQPAVTLDLMVVEEPLDSYVSPINRMVNLVLSLFDQVPGTDRRIIAMSRNLRVPSETNHVRVGPGPGPKTISVTAVLPETATRAASAGDPVGIRLQEMLGQSKDSGLLLQTRSFYDRVELAAAAQHLTIAHPSLTSGYEKMKYDYMSGYLWMFVMSFIGIIITLVFVRLESTGFIQKRGVEEAQAS
ncbi:MAG: MFS transporter [Chthoniobacteraceae bacterium]